MSVALSTIEDMAKTCDLSLPVISEIKLLRIGDFEDVHLAET